VPEIKVGDGDNVLFQLSYDGEPPTGLEPATPLLTGEVTVTCAPGTRLKLLAPEIKTLGGDFEWSEVAVELRTGSA